MSDDYCVSYRYPDHGLATSEGATWFVASTPFHVAVSRVLAEEGPVELLSLMDDMARARALGSAAVDLESLVSVMAAHIGRFGASGEAKVEVVQQPVRELIEPSRN